MKNTTTKHLAQSAARTIGEIVSEDFRTARVFENHGIDFCCGGNTSLAAACKKEKIDVAEIIGDIEAVTREPLERALNYASWSLPFLADYINNVHHFYLKEHTGHLSAYGKKIATTHGERHPEFLEISRIFDNVTAELMIHMGKEDEVLFPAIKRAAESRKAGAIPEPKDRETIKNSILALRQEHEEIGDAFHTIRHLANDFACPSDACNTAEVTFQKLKEYEADLHKHVHLENNILFRRALEL